MTDKEIKKAFRSNALYKKMLADLKEQQSRYLPEPIFSKTGKGYLKSEGVSKLQQLKQKSSKSAKSV